WIEWITSSRQRETCRGLSHVFIEDGRAGVQQKTPDAGAPVFTVLPGHARRAGGPRETWTASGPPRGHALTSFSRSSVKCRVFSLRRAASRTLPSSFPETPDR